MNENCQGSGWAEDKIGGKIPDCAIPYTTICGLCDRMMCDRCWRVHHEHVHCPKEATDSSQMEEFYETRRHDRMRARLWHEYAKVAFIEVSRLPMAMSRSEIFVAAGGAADGLLAEYDRRWPRQKEQP